MSRRLSGFRIAVSALLLSAVSAAWGQARYPELKGLQQFDVDLSSVSEQCGVTRRALGQALRSALEASQIRFATEKKGPRIQLSTEVRNLADLNVCMVSLTLAVRTSVRVLPTNQQGFAVVWSDQRLVASSTGGIPPRAVQAVREMGKALAQDWGDTN